MTSRELIDKLPIIDENIAAEAAKQPLLFVQAARYRVMMMRKRAQAQAELEYRRARLATIIRNKKGPKGEKPSENAVKERLEKQTKIRGLRAESDRAYESEEFAKLIVEAYRQRKSAIQIIQEAQQAEGLQAVKEIERGEQTRRLSNTAKRLYDRQRRLHETDWGE